MTYVDQAQEAGIPVGLVRIRLWRRFPEAAVLEAMAVPVQWAMGTVRFSVGRGTTAEEVEAEIDDAQGAADGEVVDSVIDVTIPPRGTWLLAVQDTALPDDFLGSAYISADQYVNVVVVERDLAGGHDHGGRGDPGAGPGNSCCVCAGDRGADLCPQTGLLARPLEPVRFRRR